MPLKRPPAPTPGRPSTDPFGSLGSPASLVRKSTLIYGVMILGGAAILHFGRDALATSLALPSDPYEAARLVGIGLLGAGILLVLSYFFEDFFPSFRALKTVIMRFLGPCTIPMALYLAVLTGVGEELLFRGAIQPFAGLLLTSVLFGILHMGQNGIISAWSVWAFIAGLLLGWMYEETGSLWPPIVAHFGVNAVSILSLRRTYRKLPSHIAQTPPPAPGEAP